MEAEPASPISADGLSRSRRELEAATRSRNQLLQLAGRLTNHEAETAEAEACWSGGRRRSFLIGGKCGLARPRWAGAAVGGLQSGLSAVALPSMKS